MKIRATIIRSSVVAMGLVLSGQVWAAVGETAPDFSAQTISGQSVKLSDFRGKKPVYLKFWATWCSYCKVEMPHLQQLKQEYGEDLQVITINVGMNDSVENVKSLFEKHGYDLPVIFDDKGEITAKYQVVGTPFQLLIDRDGKIAYQTFLATDELDNTLFSLISE